VHEGSIANPLKIVNNWFCSHLFLSLLKFQEYIGKVAFLILKEHHKIWTVQEKIFYESAVNSLSVFSTHPPAPHSLKISIALLRFSLALD